MRGHPDEIQLALTTPSDTVTRILSEQSWERRLIGQRAVAILTQPTGNGVIAVIEIDRM